MDIKNTETTNNELIRSQLTLFNLIEKNHKILRSKFYSSFYVIIIYLIVFSFVILGFNEVRYPLDIFILSTNISILVLIACISLFRFWPQWRLLNKKFNEIKQENQANDTNSLVTGLTPYLSEIFSDSHSSLDNTNTQIGSKKAFFKEWIILLILGIIVISFSQILVINFLFKPQNEDVFWFNLMYQVVFLNYLVLVFFEKRKNEIFKNYFKIFQSIEKIWLRSSILTENDKVNVEEP